MEDRELKERGVVDVIVDDALESTFIRGRRTGVDMPRLRVTPARLERIRCCCIAILFLVTL